jgi:sugar (pentulose or hexulose) kinase
MTQPDLPIVLGLDVGTSGVRTVAASPAGDVLAEARAPLSDLPAAAPAHEQDANAWWRALCHTTQELRASLRAGRQWPRIAGLAVTSTSGSLVLVDARGEPLRPAILYDDGRAASIASQFNRRLPAGASPINASTSLAKALWVRQEEPRVWERASGILHPADWLVAKLTGELGVCDYSNALKLGYDHETGQWSAAVRLADIPAAMLPRVVAPGQNVGIISTRAREETGVPAGVPVLAGASDGMASLIGSGASEPGQANTTLGTTLVWKVLTRTKPRLEPGMYCHHHPNGLWAPGAASNTGPGSLQFDEPGVPPAEMDRRALPHLPTPLQCYVLGSRGERFPFANPHAETFFEGRTASPAERYAAQLQSLACVERRGYERLQACAIELGDEVLSSGGAAASAILSQLRAHVLNRVVVRSAHPTASFGAAILAAGTVFFAGDLTAAIRSMTRITASYSPEASAAEKFEETYQRFRAACARHGLE